MKIATIEKGFIIWFLKRKKKRLINSLTYKICTLITELSVRQIYFIWITLHDEVVAALKDYVMYTCYLKYSNTEFNSLYKE